MVLVLFVTENVPGTPLSLGGIRAVCFDNSIYCFFYNYICMLKVLQKHKSFGLFNYLFICLFAYF